MTKILLTMSLIVWVLFLTLPALAQTDEPAKTGSMLDLVVVSANRNLEALREVTSSMTLIDEDKLQNDPSEHLDMILRREGFFVRDYPGQNSSSLEIRGFRSSQFTNDGGISGDVLIYVDGRPSPTANVARILKTNIQRVEIIRGPAALQYGPSALGGIVNIITKRGTGDLSVSARAGYGSYGRFDQSVAADGRRGGVDYSLGYYHSYGGDFKDGKNRTMYGTDDKAINSANFNVGYNFLDDRHRLGISAFLYDNHIQGTGGNISRGPSDPNTSDAQGTLDAQDQAFDIIYEGRDSTDFLSWKARYFHLRDRTENYAWDWLAVPSGRNRKLQDIYKSDVKIDGMQSQIRAAWPMAEITAGFDYTDYDIWSETTPTKMSDTAVYIIGKLKLFEDKLIINGGGRWDKFENDYRNLVIGESKSKSVTHWSPSFGIAYLPLEWLKIRANFAQGLHMPSPANIGRDTLSTYTMRHLIGNPDLKPALTTSWEFGIDLVGSYGNLSGVFFTTKYKDQIRDGYIIGFDVHNNMDIVTYKNSSNPTTYTGLEFSGSFDLGGYLDWDFKLEPYFNLTHYLKRKAYDDSYTFRWITAPFVPKWTASYGVTLDYQKIGLYANLNAFYIGTQTEQNFGINWTGIWVKVPAYTIVDFTVSKVLWENPDYFSKISLEASVNNIFDKYYEPTLDYPAPGRNFRVGVRYDFN
jgi:vitamin B12 transporter